MLSGTRNGDNLPGKMYWNGSATNVPSGIEQSGDGETFLEYDIFGAPFYSFLFVLGGYDVEVKLFPQGYIQAFNGFRGGIQWLVQLVGDPDALWLVNPNPYLYVDFTGVRFLNHRVVQVGMDWYLNPVAGFFGGFWCWPLPLWWELPS
jgi:hypothetical protein